MSFACQRDSYAKEFDTRVVSSEKAKLKVTRNGKAQTVQGHNVVFEDTILFPEGGGQNDDHGLIDGHIPVLRVTRNKEKAVHFLETKEALNPGQQVKQTVDWKRRFDHMQQHSGQHIISAVFESQFNVATTSWWMAENGDEGKVGVSFVELDTCSAHFTSSKKEEEELAKMAEKVESMCNQYIRDHFPVNVKVFDKSDSALEESKTRGLPDDVTGRIRVIEITDNKGAVIDSNMCCGTHVSNLSHLQAIKLLHWEKSKKGPGHNLYFLSGDRVLKYLDGCYKRERVLNLVLCTGPEEHVKVAEKMVKSAKGSAKKLQSVLRDLAAIDARSIKESKKPAKFFCIHRADADAEYINTLIRESTCENEPDNNILLVIGAGEVKTGGQVAICGPKPFLLDLAPQILDTLDAKGGGKGNRINAKVPSFARWSKVEQLVEEYFAGSGDATPIEK